MDWMVQFLAWLFGACETIAKLVISGSRDQQQVQHLKDEIQSFINDKDYGKANLLTDVASQLKAWQQFYQEQFNLSCDFSGVTIPKPHKGFNRLIMVAAGLTVEQVFQQCQRHFPCWKYTDRDLEIAVPKNDRTPQNGAYAIWV